MPAPIHNRCYVDSIEIEKKRATTERRIGEPRRAPDCMVDDTAFGRVDSAI